MSDQPLDRGRITQLVSTIFADDLHAKRVASLAGAAVGVLEGAALGIHAIGNALALTEGLKSKHAVKQVDRLLSNRGIPVWSLFASWVPFVVGDRPEVVTALDWTDFDDDDQSRGAQGGEQGGSGDPDLDADAEGVGGDGVGLQEGLVEDQDGPGIGEVEGRRPPRFAGVRVPAQADH